MMLMKQMARQYGKVLLSILRNRLPAVFLLKLKLLQKMADWMLLSDMQLCSVIQAELPADLK